ncbi:MAG: anhydro-N-acetylmuramic acid kinase [Bryobacteraceae bacterium]
MRVAGIMSGTSLDGIDVAVIDITGSKFDVIAHSSVPYSQKMRDQILAVSNNTAHTSEISRLNFHLAEVYARAVKRCGVPLASIQLIGSHGQTIYHERGNTLQIGDGSVLAERTGVPVVSDFRPRDIAAGGKGAPLVPYVDYLLYKDKKLGRIALNIGGIANITAIPADGRAEDVIAFDTGPGNMVIDQLVSIHTRGRQKYDRGGRFGQSGTVDAALIDRLLRRAFYKEAPPKTAGREQYGREFVQELRETGLPLIDLIATATAFTPAAVVAGIQRFVPFPVQEIVVSGGGAHNVQMMSYLQGFLPKLKLRYSSEFGIDVDAKEAIAFAVLAYETWHRRPSNLPAATGARRPVILGKVSY